MAEQEVKTKQNKETVEAVRDVKILRKVRVYLIQGGIVRERWGAVAEAGKLYLLKKKRFLRGWKIDRSKYYLVKPEHFYLEEEKRGKKYIVMSVFIDDAKGVSVPPPKSTAPPWTPEELELAQKVVSNVLIMRQFEEERRKIMQLMARIQWIMIGMFVGALVFAGVLYYFNSHMLMEQLKEIVKQIFPAPVSGGG